MEQTSLSTRTIIITLSIWLGTFFLFTCVAVTLAVTSNPLFALLILVGILPSTLAAYSYAAERRFDLTVPSDPIGVQELRVIPRATLASEISSVSLRGTAVSEPCLCRGPLALPRRSSSAPWVARYFTANSGASSQLPHATYVEECQRPEDERYVVVSRQDSQELKPPEVLFTKKEHKPEVLFTKEEQEPEVQEVGASVEKDHQDKANDGSSTSMSTETTSSGSPDVPAVDFHGWEYSKGATPLLSSSGTSSSAGGSSDVNCPYQPFREDDCEEKDMLVESISPPCSKEGIAHGNSCGAPDQLSSLQELLIVQRGNCSDNSAAEADSERTVTSWARPATANLFEESSVAQLVRERNRDSLSDDRLDNGAEHQPKRKFKLVPRFLKGKRQKFTRFK